MGADEPPRPFERHYPAIAVSIVRSVRRWRTPRLSSYAPRSTLELAGSSPARALTPAIDFHTHVGRWLTPTGGWMERDVSNLLCMMDASNTVAIVNLDGRWGSELEANLDRYDRAHPGRFYTFCHVDWRLLTERDGPDRLAQSLERSIAIGGRGLKVWKDLGLTVEVHGRRILPDDPLLGPLWETAAAQQVPVLIHVADPVAFFLPADRCNERLEELLRHPRGTRHPGGMSEFHRLIDSLEHLVASCPRTQFVVAHACYPENIARVCAMLDRYANLSIDMSAVASTLGRQPRASRSLILRHRDRVLFGTDVFPWSPGGRRVYFRLLETDDEAFTYSETVPPPCGRWQISGLNLPSSVLEMVYRHNAARLLGLQGASAEKTCASAVAAGG